MCGCARKNLSTNPGYTKTLTKCRATRRMSNRIICIVMCPKIVSGFNLVFVDGMFILDFPHIKSSSMFLRQKVSNMIIKN